MDFILNENSLEGQFDSINDFLNTLEETIKCIRLIKNHTDNMIYKKSDFYECRITKVHKILDLKQQKCDDRLLRFQLALDQEVYSEPYWDGDFAQDLMQAYYLDGVDISATCVAEAAERNQKLLSFYHMNYLDRILKIIKGKDEICIESIYTPKFLLQICSDVLKLSKNEEVKIKYENTRVDCSKLDQNYGMNQLDEDEYAQVISTLDKVVQHESWDSIALDDGLEYKKYTPESKKKDWFRGTIYGDKTIMKMRASSVLRIYGYRKKERFIVLRVETDHKISDYG